MRASNVAQPLIQSPVKSVENPVSTTTAPSQTAQVDKSQLTSAIEKSKQAILSFKEVKGKLSVDKRASVTRKLMAFFTLGKNNYVPRNIGVINEIKTSDDYFPRDRFGMNRHALESIHNWYAQ